MILILIALIAIITLSIFGVKSCEWNIISELICPIFVFLGLMGLFIFSIAAWFYFAAEQKANIINREYGTSYTQEEVFYASNVIEQIRNIDRKRLEFNGDLFKGE